jgi:predicted N-acyltransferase
VTKRANKSNTLANPSAASTTLAGSYSEVAQSDWSNLLIHAVAPSPMLRWEFLNALEQSGCTTGDTGWQPLPLTVKDTQGKLIGAAPLYAKSHSYGEYVFDWAWADAYERAGLRYFPKLLVASPFSPIPGTRLLVNESPQAGGTGHDIRKAILTAIQSQAEGLGLSSAHILFPDAEDLVACKTAGWLIRENVQFHWQNPGYGSFDDYLGALTQPKRKKVKAERRKVQQGGVTTHMVSGAEITAADLEFFYFCYERTYREHRSTPYMNLAFFQQLHAQMPEHLLLCIAKREGRPIAASFLMHADHVLYGRYWGALERVDCLHFEVAYYAPIAWAIANGITRFEGGAQGEHKLARGFTPVKTFSAHWLREPAFYDAVARFLQRESNGIEAYVNELEARSPVRR